MNKAKAFFMVFAWSIMAFSCKKEKAIVKPAYKHYPLTVPGNMPAWTDNVDNPLTEAGVKLGRLLFYDKRLSGNNQLSCSSCHQQRLAFSDGVGLNHIGLSGRQLQRNAPPLFNLLWTTNGLFWDGGSTNLESQAFGPLTHLDEMGQDLRVLEKELKAVPQYQRLFAAAFHGAITSANVVKALAQFQRTLLSAHSRYDRYQRHEGAQLTDLELEGMQVVAEKCQSCHQGNLFTDQSYHNNGLDNSYSEAYEGLSQGRFRITGNPMDMGAFKTPSLRNVMITAPYMHDGRFDNIDQVLQHYQSGIKASATVDRRLFLNQGQLGIPLSDHEKLAIKAFLQTLTDIELIGNKQFSDPNTP